MRRLTLPPVLARHRLFTAAFLAYLLADLPARAITYRLLRESEVIELSNLVGSGTSLGWYLFTAGRDLPLLLLFAAVVGLFEGAANRLGDGQRPWLHRGAQALTVGVALFLGFFANLGQVAHARLLVELHSSLDVQTVLESLEMNVSESADYAGWDELATMLTGPALFLLFALARSAGLVLARHAAIVVLSLTLFIGSKALSGDIRPRGASRDHGLVILSRDIALTLRTKEEVAAVSAGQWERMELVDPVFQRPPTGPQAAPPPPSAAGYSVLILILESVGERAAFPTDPEEEANMPFLSARAAEGWRLAAHRSPANTSPRALFSLFSGLYDAPSSSMFSTDDSVRIPGLPCFFPAEVPSFLYTPGRSDSFFPRAFLQANGLTEIKDYYSLGLQSTRPALATARHESDGVDAFIERLSRTRGERFLGVYYSYAPHYPYWDYGEELGLEPLGKKKEKAKYLRGLRFLDGELARIWEGLRAAGHGEDTLVLVLGDHGEAFGEHKGNWRHSRYSYEENLRAPVVLWQPTAISPRVDDRLTNHLDLLPTLLDLLGVAYEPALLQGESLLRGELRRRYLFSYGNEQVTTSLDTVTRTKLMVATRSGDCQAFDLLADPREKHKLDCKSLPAQHEASQAYYAFQRKQVREYNAALLSGADFFNLRQRCLRPIQSPDEAGAP
jgi:hypothetical protein